MLARLRTGAATVNELAEPFEMSTQAVSKHLKILERAGLIERGHDRQARPRKLQAEPLREVASWAAEYRRFWEERYDALESYLVELSEQHKEQDDD